VRKPRAKKLNMPASPPAPPAMDISQATRYNAAPNFGLGNYLTTDRPRLLQICDWINQRYEYASISAHPSSDHPSPTPTQLISDTWIRFYVNRIEFYQDDALNNDVNKSISISDLQAAAVARNASSLDQFNVYFTAGYMGASAFAQMPDAVNLSLDSWVIVLVKPDAKKLTVDTGADFACAGTLAHEFGHVLDLVHTYPGGGAPANCNTADADFLIDVFGNSPDCDCPHVCSWGAPLTPQQPPPPYIPNFAITNNLMRGNKDNSWVSALQAAMMHRALTEKSVKRYVVTPKLQSAQFPNVYLRMDGSALTQYAASGGGTVNCQFSAGPWEEFRFEPQGDGSVAIGSVQFPNVYLRMDGRGVTQFAASGGGTVNCQFGVGDWEKFRLCPGS
jgi:pregnancy-associated plasma protein-A